MSPTKAGPVQLGLIAACLLVLLSCPAPTADPEDTDPAWTFDADEDGWALVPYDANNDNATVSWSSSQGSPHDGALKVVTPFATTSQYVTVAAPIVSDPLTSGTDLTGKKFTVWVKSEAIFTGGALVFSNSGPNPGFPAGNSAPVSLDTTVWVPIELDLTQVSTLDYDSADMRFLGVMFFTGTVVDPPDADYTFYVDTAVIDDAP